MYNFIRTWDVYHYFLAASGILEGRFPQTEYPFGALVPMLLPRLFTSDYGTYAMLFHAQTVLVFLLGLYMILRSPAKWMAWAYASVFLVMFPMAIERLDIYVAVLALAAVWFLGRGRDAASAVMLLLSSAVKFYPIMLFPVLGLRSKRPFLFGVTAVLSAVLIFANQFGVKFHSERGVQPESLYGTVLYAKGARETEYAYNAIQLKGPEMPVALSAAMMAVFLVPLLFVDSFWKRPLRVAYQLTLAFILSFKVLSPTYVLWIAPFLPFVGKRRAILVVAASVLTMWYLGFYEQAVVRLELPYVVPLLLRNAALLAAIF